jgi:oxazoline/thiazoline dehydrogenase
LKSRLQICANFCRERRPLVRIKTNVNFILCFPAGTKLHKHSSTDFEIHSTLAQIRIRDASAEMALVLGRMAGRGGTEQELSRLFKSTEDAVKFHFYLQYFAEQRILCHRVCSKGKPFATIEPISHRYQFEYEQVRPNQMYILSRFVYLRRDHRQLILESPLSHARLILHEQQAAVFIAALVRPTRVTNRSLRLFELLWNCRALSGPEDNELLQWDYHDLLFHSRSRVGRHSNAYGKTDHLVEKIAPQPAVKQFKSRKSISLYTPNMERLMKADIPFTRVLETRRSQRNHGAKAITQDQLGEFLFRSSRVCRMFSADGAEYTQRVYPGTGAAYELELYLAIDRCNGIPSGLYHYDPLHHRVEPLSEKTSELEQLLQSAGSTVHASIPQILIIVSARFLRISFHYESISYAAILKDVGVLYQTFYLVANAMGLAACALGVGNSDLFAEAAGTDYYEETSVGEFILGTVLESG